MSTISKKQSPRRESKKPTLRQVPLWSILVGAFVGVVGVILAYILYWPNLTPPTQDYYLYVRTGWNYDSLLTQLRQQHLLANEVTYSWVAQVKGLPMGLKPGRYAVLPQQGNLAFVRMLRAGLQTPVQLKVLPTRRIHELAENVGKQLETGPDSLHLLLTDKAFLRTWGFNPETVIAMFIPNNYSVYWTVRPRVFLRRMHQEYERFWTEERRSKATNLHLTPLQVSILASVVEAETYRNDEKPRIAGVYLNRLQQGMPLQADPTVIFALNDYSIRRVLKRHLSYPSPYNTYLHTGLMPGPINCPSIASLDAVLNAERHHYLYFSARSDFSGYHNFNVTLAAHERDANEYRTVLNQQNQRRAPNP